MITKISDKQAWKLLKGDVALLASTGHVNNFAELRNIIKPSLFIIPEMEKKKMKNASDMLLTWNDDITIYRDEISCAELQGKILYFKTTETFMAFYIAEKRKKM